MAFILPTAAAAAAAAAAASFGLILASCCCIQCCCGYKYAGKRQIILDREGGGREGVSTLNFSG